MRCRCTFVLLLGVIHERATLDRIAEYVFITVRAGEFGLDDGSLNGDSIFAFGELAAKRELVREALKGLVVDGVVDVTDGNEGITYSLTDSGRGLDEGLVSEYASRYRTVMKKVNRRYRNKSDVELAGIINRQSTKISKR